MKRFVSVVLCASLALSSLPALAEDPKGPSSLQDIPPGQDKIVPVRKGDAAPFDGQLFDNSTALRWGNWLLQYKFRLDADVQLQKKLGEADAGLWQKKYELMEDKYKVVTVDYQKQVAYWQTETSKAKASAAEIPWYHSTLLGFALGVVVTGVAVGVGAYAIHTSR